MAEFTMDKMAKQVAEKALDDYVYQGRTIREWIAIIARNVWIPVSERPPKRGEEVIVSNHYHFWDGNELDSVETLYYEGADELGHVFQTRFGARTRNVVAWMPLPEPYKVESEE